LTYDDVEENSWS